VILLGSDDDQLPQDCLHVCSNSEACLVLVSLHQAASLLKSRELVRWVFAGDLKQVKAIEPSTILCGLRAKAWWAWIQGMKRLVERPLLPHDEGRHWLIHGNRTEQRGLGPVLEDVIGAPR
jgi:hypothetical protein